jgi:hypothetical protein
MADNPTATASAAVKQSQKITKSRPLQVVVVSSEPNEPRIRLDEEGMEELQASLAACTAKHGDLPLAVYSVAGAFREGKSFMLDCFLRYLYHLENSPEDDLVLENEVESSFLMVRSRGAAPLVDKWPLACCPQRLA